jgi:hypothetical protein
MQFAFVFLILAGSVLLLSPQARSYPDTPDRQQFKGAGPQVIAKGFPKRAKGERKRGKGGGENRRGAKSDGERGKCGRLAEKHGIPRSECRKMTGEKKCRRLAEKHGLSARECKSL